ncbi:hypothetical protein Zmor_016675 [Zophobas morio]|uniref:Uncharacterized protein n=1 Tax=Zophobas morio TaxID=2755281 RepID=A0AA38MB86_9CUCU|nr:hypothetical protein Zmor_003716 [Zophobas morio]KAJ3650585.1 hypothetical protein Zmor_016675 [Zophobas morio]
MLQNEDTSNSSGQSIRKISLLFEKRTGTTDRGKDYEHLYITHLLLKLITDDRIEDFYLSSNDKKFGSFDDIVVNIKYHDQKNTTQTYAIQLKQSKNTIVRTRNLTSEKGNFSISQYLEDYTKNLSKIPNLKLILFTNCSTQIDRDFKIKTGGEELDLQVLTVTENYLFSTHSQPWCHKFTTNKYEKFFNNFSLYSAQADVDRLEAITSKSFCERFHTTDGSFTEFSSFICRWSVKSGSKEKLYKEWVKKVIMLCVLGPLVKPLVFCGGRGVNDKGRIFREVVAEMRVVTVAQSSYRRIKTVWQDVVELLDDDEMTKVDEIRTKYQIRGEFKLRSDLYKEDKDVSKVLWLLGKCPLVVEEHPAVYQAMPLGGTFIVVSAKVQKNFLSISDILCDQILNAFTYSLEEQKEETLKSLYLESQFWGTITTDNLVQMIDGPLVIGQPEVSLPPCHVTRTLWKIFIDLGFLKDSTNTVLVISGLPNVELFCCIFDYVEVFDFDSSERLDHCNKTNGNVVYVSQRVIPQEEFDKFCATKKRKCYQFKYVRQCYEWLRGTNIEEIKKYRLNHEYVNDGISEYDLFGDGENNINIVCANSGMGKSTLMKSLKRNSSSKTWTIFLYARKYALLCRQKVDVDVFLTNLAIDICQKYDDADIFKTLMSKRRVRIIWDGLDEVSNESLDAIINTIKQISSTKIKQWVTARNTIKTLLETKLQTFSYRIKQFSSEEQRVYIQKRLNFADSELFEIFKTVEIKMQPFCNNDVLGVPLQIYMLTELFSRNKKKYLKLLNRTFTLLDLYENFVREKFYVHYVEKLKLDLSIEDNYAKFVREMEQRLECYKRVAFDTYLSNKGLLSYFQKPDSFLVEVKTKRDFVGFISTVSDEMVPEFVHNSFGEYFAAAYLFDNDKNKARDPRFTQNDDYNNIRFFLDLMLTKTSRAHSAVLNKNSMLLDECSAEDLKSKDLVGRGVLELSCAWSKQYEIVKIQKMGFGRFNIHSRYLDDNAKRLQYGEVYRDFVKTEDPRMTKLLLLLPFLVSVYSKMRLDDECAAMVIYYSVVFDYAVIFKYVDEVPELKRTYDNFDPVYLLSVALIYESRQCLQEFALKKPFRDALGNNLDILLYACQLQGQEIFSVIVEHVVDINQLIYCACCQGRFSNVHFLVTKGVKTYIPDDHGRTPIHYSADNEIDGLRILDFLLLIGESPNILDKKNRHPLHYACMNGRFGPNIVQMLLNTKYLNHVDIYNRVPLHYACDNEDCGLQIVTILLNQAAQTQVPDVNGLTPLHYACMNWKQGSRIVDLLMQANADKTVQDFNGRTPLHYACKNYFRGSEIVDLLVDNTLVDTPDSENRLPLHDACERGSCTTVQTLMRHSDKIDPADNKGQTPLHNACKNYVHGDKIVQLLFEKRAKIDSEDLNGRQPLHYACEFGKAVTVSFLLLKGAKVNKVDGQGRLPIHYACMNVYQSPLIVKLLIDRISRVGVADAAGLLPIHYACEYADVNCVQFLIDKSEMQLVVPDAQGRVALHYACLNFNHGLDIVRFLIRAGAKWDVKDKWGRMPLHYACQTGNIYNVVGLIDVMGGSINVGDLEGRKPIDYARKGKNYNVVQLLKNLESGGSLEVPL